MTKKSHKKRARELIQELDQLTASSDEPCRAVALLTPLGLNFRIARYPRVSAIDPQKPTYRYKPVPVAHREQVPEAVRIPLALDAGAATVAARAPAQVAVRTFIVR